MFKTTSKTLILSMTTLLLLSACQAENHEAGPIVTVPPVVQNPPPTEATIALHNIQNRTFDTTDKVQLQSTIVATLQDLSYTIDKADATSVTATKSNGHVQHMAVTLRDHGPKETLVHAAALNGGTPIDDALPYKQFFTVLEKAMLLTANDAE
jgi:hypothetical protein